MRIAIIGAGISGIVAAHCLGKSGHQVTAFEKSNELGGVWALGYPGVRLQNTAQHYRISDVPWPFIPDRHPTSGQVTDYLKHAVIKLELDIRTPRWLIPFHILGIHYAKLMFCRMATLMMPSWAYPTSFERFLHQKLGFLVAANFSLAKLIFTIQCRLHGLGKSKKARAGLKTVLPEHDIVGDLRSAAAMAPEDYYQNIADEKILLFHAELDRFVETGLKLKDGSVIECDQVVLSLGSESPKFPFFADKYRLLLEAEDDGVQLYRHLLHPKIPNVAFAGFNHGFMHVPAVEVSMLWLSAYLDGDLKLPSIEQMQQSIRNILEWKRRHIHYEPSRSCAVNTRFQQYIDIMLKELGISPYRKMPNVFAELFSQYGASDYEGILEEYKRVREKTALPRQVLQVDT